jgi:hypothetical protein
MPTDAGRDASSQTERERAADIGTALLIPDAKILSASLM